MGCDPKEVALKSFFLGPQAENAPWVRELVEQIFEDWFEWRRQSYPADGRAISAADMQLAEFQERRRTFLARLHELSSRFEREVPKFSPRYVGHMFSEISLPALLGHLVALLHNPNNISGESARVGVQIEEEALQALQAMLGFPGQQPRGHFTSGGTLANFEALVRARARIGAWLAAGTRTRANTDRGPDLFSSAHMGWEAFLDSDASISALESWNPYDGDYEAVRRLEMVFGVAFKAPVALIPQNSHYSWKKGLSLIGLGMGSLWPIALDRRGRLSVTHLEELLERARAEQRPVLMVVSVAGSTELGTIDPVHEVQEVLDRWAKRGYHIWHHIDAAYGGFFCSIDLSEKTRSPSVLSHSARASLRAVRRATSVTLDPHKLGYVPYSCGAFLCRDFQDYSMKPFGAPYVQNTRTERGLFTLEGSRPATGAAATWMTAKSIGFDPAGYGRILERTILIKRSLESALIEADPRIRIAPHTDTNILAFTVAARGSRLSRANAAAERIHESLSPAGTGPFFVSKTRLSIAAYEAYLLPFLESFSATIDSAELTVVRVCIMNPFFDSLEMQTDFSRQFVNTVLSEVE